MSRPHSYSNTKNRLHDLHDRIQRGQAASEDLLTLVSCVEGLVADLEKPQQEVTRLLRGLRNQQRIFNTHVAAIEDSLIFRFLRRLQGPDSRLQGPDEYPRRIWRAIFRLPGGRHRSSRSSAYRSSPTSA